jgi:hypothetical protein
MMGCSALGGTEKEITINGSPAGILSGHAYSITDVILLPNVKMEVEREVVKKKEGDEDEEPEIEYEFVEEV